MKIAIVHYWLVGMRGGEKVLESLIDIYPNADIYTNVYDKSKISEKIKNQNVFTTFINKIPFSKKYYKYFLPIMPIALFSLNLKKYDLIISSESGPSKGFRKNIKSLHICYCHSPMRYIWDMTDQYLKNMSILKRLVAKFFFPILRIWDVKTASTVDEIIVNSHFVQERVEKFWNRKSFVLAPPVDIDSFKIDYDSNKDYYLVLSQLVPYKKVDLAVKAFNKLNKKLLVIGEGDDIERLKAISNDNISFLGWQSDKNKKEYLANSKALIFPGIEDFGIVPIESMASGRPVLAFKKGGSLDYIKHDVNGIFFIEQSIESLIEAVINFENKFNQFDSDEIKKTVYKFDKEIFKTYFSKFVEEKLKN